MIEKILEVCKEYQVNEVVITDELMSEYADCIRSNDLVVQQITDARSAVFFALGRINILKRPVIVMVTGDSVSNALTGMTEAYYQYLPLILVEVGTEVEKNYECFKNITYKSILFMDQEQICNEMLTYFNSQSSRPIHLQVKTPRKNSQFRVENSYIEKSCMVIQEITQIEETIEKQIFVSLSGVDTLRKNIQNDGSGIKLDDNKYGVVSIFLGHTIVSSKINYLITDYERICKDINAFGLDQGEKLVVLYYKDKTEKQEFSDWFLCNKYSFCKITSLSELRDVISNEKKPLVIEYQI